MIDPITLIAGWLGMDPAIILGTIPIIVLIANFFARLIPDDATGFVGFLRKAFAIIGMSLSSRISPGQSIKDVVIATKTVVPRIDEVSRSADPTMPTPESRFTPPEFRTLLMLALAAPLLLAMTACTSSQSGVFSAGAKAMETARLICYNREALQYMLNSVKPNPYADKVQPILDYLHTTCPLFFSQVDPELYQQTLQIRLAAKD